MASVTKAAGMMALPSEPSLALIERRLAALHQTKKFHPDLPFSVLFSEAESRVWFGVAEENITDGNR
jgi:hypothetical protein